jgi:hypothetical protein
MQLLSAAPAKSGGGVHYWTKELGPGEEVILFSRCSYSTSRLGAASGYVALTDARVVFLAEGSKGGNRRFSLTYDQIEACFIGRRINFAVSLGSLNECIVLRDRAGKEHSIWPWGVGVRPETIRSEIDQQRLAIAV